MGNFWLNCPEVNHDISMYHRFLPDKWIVDNHLPLFITAATTCYLCASLINIFYKISEYMYFWIISSKCFFKLRAWKRVVVAMEQETSAYPARQTFYGTNLIPQTLLFVACLINTILLTCFRSLESRLFNF